MNLCACVLIHPDLSTCRINGAMEGWLINSGVVVQFSSVTQSCLTLQLQGLQHARPPCLSLTLRVYPNSCPLSRWCHPTISSSVVPFFTCPPCFPASGSFQMRQFFASDGQILELHLQHQSFHWIFRTDFLSDGLVESPCCPRDSQESSPTPQFKSINWQVLINVLNQIIPSLESLRMMAEALFREHRSVLK